MRQQGEWFESEERGRINCQKSLIMTFGVEKKCGNPKLFSLMKTKGKGECKTSSTLQTTFLFQESEATGKHIFLL